MMSPKTRMALAISLGSAALIGGVGLTVSSAWLITMAAQHPPILVLSVSIVMVRFFGITRSVARYAERIVSHESVFRRLTDLRVQLFEKISNRTSLLVRDLNSGSYVKAIVDDVERAQEYQLRVTLPGFSTLISVMFVLLLGMWIFPPLLVIFLPASISLLLVIPSVVSRKCVAQSWEIETAENRYALELAGAHFGALEAKIYGYLNQTSRKLQMLESCIQESERALLRSIRTLQFLTLLIIGAAIAGTSLLISTYNLNVSLPAVKISMAIFLPLVAFEGVTNWYPNLFVSGKLLRAQREVDTLIHEDSRTEAVGMDVPMNSNLQIESVTVAWDKPFMKPVSADVNSGEVLVIRGNSGSGKSTLALALTGLLQYQGSIRIGGMELRTISEIHKYVSASLQRGHIFNTSLRENLKIANPDLDDVELKRMMGVLELDAISLDEVVGDFGRALSGGEAKRLGVARALLSNAPIVLLDEPTEHLDDKLAARLETRIVEECRNRSLIIITHSGWAKSNRTVLIERE